MILKYITENPVMVSYIMPWYKLWSKLFIVVGSLGLGNLGWTKVTYVVYPHR